MKTSERCFHLVCEGQRVSASGPVDQRYIHDFKKCSIFSPCAHTVHLSTQCKRGFGLKG